MAISRADIEEKVTDVLENALGADRDEIIATATLTVLEAAGARLRFEEAIAGLAAVESQRDPLPPETIASIDFDCQKRP